MSDKQKEIEEIYKIIDNDCALINNCIECQFGKQDKFDCDKLCVANAIYNAGYRKIPENAVVLTRERYEELEKSVDSVQVAVSSFTRLETLYKIKCKELEIANKKLEELKGGKID